MEKGLYQLALARRSIRNYTGEPVGDAELEAIMKVALAAPSSFGHRPVEFVVVRDTERIRQLAACKSLGGTQIIGAGAVIVVMVKLDRDEFWIEDGAIASSYILLAAEEQGLGACWVHIRNRTGRKKPSDEEVRELLGVPDGYAVLNLIAIGGKAERKAPYAEGDFDMGKVHCERY
ncbi:MAG: nitroreductase family protein [Coriobacteriia bacterium]|nr:nitroreductase family protein [Coriobacteriia bacterium]